MLDNSDYPVECSSTEDDRKFPGKEHDIFPKCPHGLFSAEYCSVCATTLKDVDATD